MTKNSCRPAEAVPFKLWDCNTPRPDGIAPAREPDLTPYFSGRENRGTVIVCPGGGYAHLANHEGETIGRWLAAHGINAFVLRYRIAPHRHPAPLLDAQRALRLVRTRAAEWALPPDKLAILGFSAGGHLAASASTHFDAGNPAAPDPVDRVSCRPDASILCYAVISLGEFSHKGSVANLLGDKPESALLRSLSNETQVTQDTPPAFLWHTAEDKGVPVQNSLLYAQALAERRVPFELHVFPSGAHGLGLAGNEPGARQWGDLCLNWLEHLGF